MVASRKDLHAESLLVHMHAESLLVQLFDRQVGKAHASRSICCAEVVLWSWLGQAPLDRLPDSFSALLEEPSDGRTRFLGGEWG